MIPHSGELGQAGTTGASVSHDEQSLRTGKTWQAAHAVGTPVMLIVLLLVAWELAVHTLAIPVWLLPSPSRIAWATWEARALLWSHTQQTLLETWLGLGLALASGLILAIAIDMSALLRRALYPLLVASQTVPIIAIAPLLIIGFGFGMLPKVLVVALVCFFPIAINTADGLRSIDPDLVSLLHSMGATRWQTFLKARLPAALPNFFSGMKVAVTYGMMGAVIGEWVGAKEGLGVFMLRSSHSYLTDRVFAAILVISSLSILMFLVVIALERALLPWHCGRGHQEQWEDLGHAP